MTRIDHVAYRVKNRDKTAKFFQEAFGYKVQTEFDIQFDDGTSCKCIALEPPEKSDAPNLPWTCTLHLPRPDLTSSKILESIQEDYVEYHMAPEIFVSSSEDENSIVGKWVKHRDGIGGIHHIAYQVPSVEQTMKEWKEKGYAEFSSDSPIICPDGTLTQVFTKPSSLTGVIYEFIERRGKAFCQDSVKLLMVSTAQNR